MVVMRLSASLAHSCATLLGAAALVLTGCGGGAVSADKARGQVVAEAAGTSLSGATLDRWLLKAPIAPTKVAASGLVSAWLNTTLLIDAVRRDAPLDDAITTDSVIAEDAGRGMLTQYFVARARARPPVTEEQVDSLLSLDQVRVFQQIVVRVKPGTDTGTIRKIGNSTRSLATKLQAGGDFTAAVKQYSEDTLTRSRNGFVPAITETEMAGQLRPIWNLQPGVVAPPVPGRDGFHILRRATRDEARPLLKEWLAPRLARRADSLFVDSLARARAIVIAPDARLRVRAMALEPVAISSGGPLVTWKGGSLGPAEVRDAVLMLPPDKRVEISDASDTNAAQFLTGLARRDILMPLVSSDPPPNAAARATLVPEYRRMVDSLRAIVKRMPANLSAGDAATQWVDSVLARRAPFLPLPGSLASVLRGRSNVAVNQPVLDGVLRGALPRWQEAHRADSTMRGGAGAAPPAAPTGGVPPQ
jgi:hypothetical protein